MVCVLLIAAALMGCGGGDGKNTLCHDGTFVSSTAVDACIQHGGYAGANLNGIS